MKSKETPSHPEKVARDAINHINHLHYTLSDFKMTPAIIDADAVQLSKYSRGRPAVFTEIIIA